MKITPIAAGSAGNPGQNIGSVEVGRSVSPDRIAKATAIAAGKEYVQPTDPQADRIQSTRKITMKTNATPMAPEPVQEPESSIPDTTETEPEVIKPLSPQLAALAREKRSAQVMKAEAQKLMADAEAKLAAANDVIPTSRLKSETLKVLEEAGLLDSEEFYNSLTERIVNGQSNPEIEALRNEIKTLKEGVDNRFTSQQTQQEESALTEMLHEAEALAKDGEAYEQIRSTDGFEKVLRKIHAHYKATGQVLKVADVMNQVEEELIKDAERYFKSEKLKTKYLQPTQQLQPQRTMRTLTARDNATAPMSAKARAMAAFNGTLKR